MAQVNVKVTSPEDEKRAKNIEATFKSIEKVASNIKSLFSSAFDFANNQLSDPLKGIQNMVQQLSGVDLSKITSYSNILSEIASITKTVTDEQISWQQTLIGIYKNVAQVAKGSWQIYNSMAQTHRLGKDTLMQWNEWGGYAEGVRLAVELASHSTNTIGQLSNDLLLNWHKQNMALGISNEESAKMVGFMARAGVSVKESVVFQQKLANSINKSYNSQALTSKILTKVTSSNFAILLYQEKNLSMLSKIAIQAHEWNVEIDEIYQTSMKLAKAEESIETARKFQLAFGIQLNARQMQYNAQTGKHLDNMNMIVHSLKDQGIQFSQLTLAQQQVVADTLAGGDLVKAQNILLGKQKGIVEESLSPQQQMTNSMENQNKLLTAMHDTMANWATYFIMIRASLWEPWMKNLTFIFGQNQKINSAQDLSLAFEKERVRVIQQLFLPMVERLNNFFGKGRSLLGEQNSFISKMIPMFSALGEKVAIIGESILNWIYNENIFEKIANSIKRIDAVSIAEALVKYGREFVKFITSIDTKELTSFVSNLVNAVSYIWKIGKFLVDVFGSLNPILIMAVVSVGQIVAGMAKAAISGMIMKTAVSGGGGAAAAGGGMFLGFKKAVSTANSSIAKGIFSSGGKAMLGGILRALPGIGAALAIGSAGYLAYKVLSSSKPSSKIEEQKKTNSVLSNEVKVSLDDASIEALSSAIINKLYMNKQEAIRTKRVIPVLQTGN